MTACIRQYFPKVYRTGLQLKVAFLVVTYHFRKRFLWILTWVVVFLLSVFSLFFFFCDAPSFNSCLCDKNFQKAVLFPFGLSFLGVLAGIALTRVSDQFKKHLAEILGLEEYIYRAAEMYRDKGYQKVITSIDQWVCNGEPARHLEPAITAKDGPEEIVFYGEIHEFNVHFPGVIWRLNRILGSEKHERIKLLHVDNISEALPLFVLGIRSNGQQKEGDFLLARTGFFGAPKYAYAVQKRQLGLSSLVGEKIRQVDAYSGLGKTLKILSNYTEYRNFVDDFSDYVKKYGVKINSEHTISEKEFKKELDEFLEKMSKLGHCVLEREGNFQVVKLLKDDDYLKSLGF